MSTFHSLILAALVPLLTGCRQEMPVAYAGKRAEPTFKKYLTPSLSQEFKAYWFDGTAELTSFDLEQVRYGEVRKATAVTVFVTEDFSKSRGVKLDHPKQHPEDRVKVLKFNLNKQFTTGIYDYALMQSVFTPIDQRKYPNTLRVTTSNIEWCGQFLTRAELQGDNYHIAYNSYFDGEENLELELPVSILEDEIWNQIRIDPDRLPQGVIELVPGILTQELTHKPLKVEPASATLWPKGATSVYEIEYSEIPRKLRITFETEFPYHILGWEETFMTVAGWGMEPKLMTTKARKIKHTKTDYWEKKYVRHEGLREELLGLKD